MSLTVADLPGRGVSGVETIGEDLTRGKAECGLLVGMFDAGETFVADEGIRDEVDVVIVGAAEVAVGAYADDDLNPATIKPHSEPTR